MVFGFSKLFLRISKIKMPPKQRKHIKIETDSIKTPENYPVAYDNIRIMRKDMSAPVDTMGCEKVKNSSHFVGAGFPYISITSTTYGPDYPDALI